MRLPAKLHIRGLLLRERTEKKKKKQTKTKLKRKRNSGEGARRADENQFPRRPSHVAREIKNQVQITSREQGREYKAPLKQKKIIEEQQVR